MKITMLENGLDFVVSSVKSLKAIEQPDCKNKNTKIKYCLLHLSAGIELILKSRLYIEHWTYIFADMNKADKKAIENGSFKSVEFAQAIERLEKLCSVSIEKNIKMTLKS